MLELDNIVLAVFIATNCFVAFLGFYQERPGPQRCVAGMGDGLTEGREPFRSEGEVLPLSQGTSGLQPA